MSTAIPVHLPAPEGMVMRILYARALHRLAQESPRRWHKVSETFSAKPVWWCDRFIAHNKRMADKGIPNAVELVARVTALRMKT